MPTAISDVVKKSKEIEQAVKFWEFSNPRLFKGIEPEEENNLFILIAKQSEQANIRMLEIALEQLLPCAAYVCEEDKLNPEYKTQILEQAISLSDKARLLQLFKDITFGEKPNLTEEEQRSQAHELDVFNFVKEGQEKKHKHPKEASSLVEQGLFRAEKKQRVEEEISKVIASNENPQTKGQQVGQLLTSTLTREAQVSCVIEIVKHILPEKRWEIQKLLMNENIIQPQLHT